jgi:A/G-specific adenine glycosylase
MQDAGSFKRKIRTFYRSQGRDLPWRRTRDPYRILVSEIMLQQTQVDRVKSFYENFIKRFPDFRSLAHAKKSDVLRAWQGLGYNRRALSLRETARIVAEEYGGALPRKRETLESLPGIGPYTAGAIRAFAFNEPEVFIETNIRRVFIHSFFPARAKVSDRDILPLIERTLDPQDPRAWYFALMDYGAMLGTAERVNPNRRSAHYVRQSKFGGSDREIRGKILRLVLAQKAIRVDELVGVIPQPKDRVMKIVDALSREGFLKKKSDVISL